VRAVWAVGFSPDSKPLPYQSPTATHIPAKGAKQQFISKSGGASRSEKIESAFVLLTAAAWGKKRGEETPKSVGAALGPPR